MSDDITRLRNEYEDRKHRLATSDVYSFFNKSTLFGVHQRQRVTLNILKKLGFTHLSDVSILEMGCGGGGVLTEFLGFGAVPGKLFGIDLLFDRLQHAQTVLPGSHFANADGSHLPFPDHSFDLVLQYTALSSILDPILREGICRDMLRVLRSPDPASGKPGSMILWYDFWLNPVNPQTRGVRPGEIKQLFPNSRYEFHRITLAPPIARRLVPLSWGGCLFLESLKIFNTHYLVSIRPLPTDH